MTENNKHIRYGLHKNVYYIGLYKGEDILYTRNECNILMLAIFSYYVGRGEIKIL